MSYHKNEDINNFYALEEELGRGSFAVVCRGVNRETGEEVAIKIFDKWVLFVWLMCTFRSNLTEDDEIQLQTEVDILS